MTEVTSFELQMNLPRRHVCFFVLFGVFLLGKVLPCELPSGERTKCGDVSSKQDCPKTCCFDTSTTPNYYFKKNAYGPIQYSNGLCINVKDDKHTLIWSRDCSSGNAFFLVSFDYPPYHVATGRCVLPATTLGDPGKATDLFLTSGKDCNSDVTYRPSKNGNLEYFYFRKSYNLCIGSKSLNEPRENEKVSIRETICTVNNTCKLSYVYERKFSKGENANIECESCSTIEVIWANYGVQVSRQYPFAISTRNKDCVTTNARSVVQNKCNGNTRCSFRVQSRDFLPSKSICGRSTILLVRFKCKSKISAPLQATGTKSATSFQIKLRALQNDDIYVQIVVSKQQRYTKPTSHPGHDLQPYGGNPDDNKPYITAELGRNYVNKKRLFTVGDDKIFVERNIEFQNVKLEPEAYYSIFQRTFKSADLYYDSDWMDVIRTDKLPPSTPPTPLTDVVVITTKKGTITQPEGGCSHDGTQDAGAEDGEKYLAGIIVLIVLLIISFMINAYFIYQNRRPKSSKEISENKNMAGNISTNIDENPENHDANYEQVEDEQSTYTALKRPEDGDDHLYTHLLMNELQHDYMNQKEVGIQ